MTDIENFISVYDYKIQNNLPVKTPKSESLEISTYARHLGIPIRTKIVPHSPFAGGKICMYPYTYLNNYYKNEK